MKSIILYGVRGIRKDIETYLSNQFQIIGYSDSDPIYSDVLYYEYKPFFQLHNISRQPFDYILICTKDISISYEIVSKLLSVGVPQYKIIESCYVIHSVYQFDIPLVNYVEMNQQFDGLCFGMSYSYNCFLTHFFSKNFYKLSYFGADFYFHKQNIEYLADKKSNSIRNVSYIVFDLPYYCFNWDLSKAKKTIRNRFSLLEPFNDYHNYGTNTLEKWYIKEYKILKQMFYKKLQVNKSSFSNNFEPRIFVDFDEQKDHFSSLEHVWTSIHQDTIHENIYIFRKILDLLNTLNPRIKICIVIFPMYLEFLEENKQDINNMKRIFYNIINDFKKNFNIQIIDCFEMFQDKTLYFDVHHLNSYGGYKISTFLESEFQKNLYYDNSHII